MTRGIMLVGLVGDFYIPLADDTHNVYILFFWFVMQNLIDS